MQIRAVLKKRTHKGDEIERCRVVQCGEAIGVARVHVEVYPAMPGLGQYAKSARPQSHACKMEERRLAADLRYGHNATLLLLRRAILVAVF